MKKFLLGFKKKSRPSRGFSMVEVVIAMTVIVAVTISAISVVMSGINVEADVDRRFEAQTIVGNAIECFKVTDDYEGKSSTLARTLHFYDNYEFETNVPDEGEAPEGRRYAKFTFDRPTYIVAITVFYNEVGARDKLFASVVEKETNDVIFQTEYEKGSGQS